MVENDYQIQVFGTLVIKQILILWQMRQIIVQQLVRGLHDREIPIRMNDHDNYSYVNNNVEPVMTSGSNCSDHECEQCESGKTTDLEENMSENQNENM